jgi:NAD(P)-dependent dehydrogenase (short-subunit alcohol dehydrogenase family)
MATVKPSGYVVPSSDLSEEEIAALASTNALVVGGTGGIGKALTDQLARRGAKVTIVGRKAPEGLPENVKFVSADFNSVKVARETARGLKDEVFDLIVFTTGIFPGELVRTSEGLERDLAVSYLSRYVIMQEFLANGLATVKLPSGKRPRVFIMGFPGAKNEGNLKPVMVGIKHTC